MKLQVTVNDLVVNESRYGASFLDFQTGQIEAGLDYWDKSNEKIKTPTIRLWLPSTELPQIIRQLIQAIRASGTQGATEASRKVAEADALEAEMKEFDDAHSAAVDTAIGESDAEADPTAGGVAAR
jgi:hypothetical protein